MSQFVISTVGRNPLPQKTYHFERCLSSFGMTRYLCQDNYILFNINLIKIVDELKIL